ncbi:molybdopterin synthase sulfur carrier subunit [Amycolatopsis antarctica]|uniref:Molybdopterin synthase sulfur carrier subunit n=1 Tax=Amycolatopsis antarctica TaxID=1854586 RepID=A0A263CWM7_9PSEU|nr:MoaD/ThiS family protein [Amycolatopsis antarctica]OZM70543.1 molybdopterin synthase sulfur carrier subunit [Amycolatopsis antarctica]
MTVPPSGATSPGPVQHDLATGHATTVLVRYFAAARAATSIDEELVQLPAGASVADAVAALRERHPAALPRILDAASFLLDGVAVRDTSARLPDGTQLDVLPPFAGG